VQWVTALAAAIDAKDHYTNGHSEQVAKLAVELARATGQARELVELVQFAGQMHDIGKIGIPESILHKPGTLTAEEWAIMRVHPNIGARILSPIATLQSAIPIVLHHHERWDGQGYPDGLAGEAIPLGARMIAICDAFDTMVSDRPYRRALSDEDALGRLRSSAGSQFDPRLVEAFVSLADVQEDLASAVSR
jgi:HD-GYP domain-containing protein (c-di-GMP phosphodiesterase class II)